MNMAADAARQQFRDLNEGDESEFGQQPRRSTRIIDTPSSTPDSANLSRGGFDMLAFVSAQRMVILDEADLLLEGSEAARTKKFLQEVWMRFEPPPGLEPPSARERRNRWRRDHRNKREDYRASRAQDALEADESAALALVRSAPPFGRARQYVFAAATLANISPLTSFQFLLNLFTPRGEQPPEDVSGPRSFEDGDLPPSAQIKLRITRGMHHLSPLLSREGTVEWTRVGGAARESNKEWDESQIDFARLDALDSCRNGGGGQGELDAEEEETRALMAAEDLARRARSNRRLLEKMEGSAALAPGKKAFPSRKDLAEKRSKQQGAGADEGEEEDEDFVPLEGRKKSAGAERFTERVDLEKVRATVRFLNSHTPAPSAPGASAPPAKSLLFVSTTARLATLLSHLRTLQSKGRGEGPSAEDLAAGRALSPHVQLLPYHADLRADERARTMQTFNSRAAAAAHSLPSGAQAPVAHQVLLSTSLAARGLDFEQAAPGVGRAPKKMKSLASSAPEQRAGFACMVQFDLATNVVDYIHRCGRMFRHRPTPVSASDAAAQEPAAQAEDEESKPKLLHLYTADDELLVSHLREAAAAAGEGAGTFIGQGVFSRNRLLRVKAKKAERAAREAQRSEAEQWDNAQG